MVRAVSHHHHRGSFLIPSFRGEEHVSLELRLEGGGGSQETGVKVKENLVNSPAPSWIQSARDACGMQTLASLCSCRGEVCLRHLGACFDSQFQLRVGKPEAFLVHGCMRACECGHIYALAHM